MAIHRRLDSFSLIFYLLLILWVKTELHQNLPQAMKYEILDTLFPTHNPVEDERINQKCGKPATSNII